MYINNKLSKAVQLAIAFGAASTAFSAFAQDTSDGAKVERIEITGSRIKRTDLETATPVTVFDATAIKNTGAVTVAEFLRENASTGGFSEVETLSQVAGSSSMGVKGFGREYTLVLLNGRRLPKNAIGSAVFTDVNQVPMAAVERIEVLGDGAAAIYGSDAVAGVINIITKTDYDGVNVNVTYGANLKEHDGNETGFSFVAGAGNDKTNILFAADYFSRSAIPATNRELGQTAWLRDADGNTIRGGDGRSPTGIPGQTRIRGSAVSDAMYIPWSDCAPENIGSYADGDKCLYDTAPQYFIAPESERYSLLTIVNHQVTDDFKINGQFRYSHVYTETSNAPAPGTLTNISKDSPFIEDHLFNDIFKDDHVTAAAVYQEILAGTAQIDVQRRFLDFPNRTADNINETFEAIGGFEYFITDDYQLTGDIGFSRLTSRQIGTLGNLLDADTRRAFSGELLNPFAINDCAKDAATVALCDSLQAKTHRTGTYEIGFGTLILSGVTNIELPGGRVGFATGIDVRNERYSDVSDPAKVAGQVIGGASSNGGGEFKNQAAFLELSLPVIDALELSLAVRHDKADWGVSDEDKTTYSGKISYRPMDNLLLRASYGTGFKAPNLANLFLATSSGVISGTVDTKLCNEQMAAGGSATEGACKPQEINSRSGGNAELKAEESKSYGLGFVYEPIDGLSVSVDYWSLSIDNVIGSMPIQEVLDEEAEGRLTEFVVRNAQGTLTDTERTGYVLGNLQNMNEQSAKGITYDLTWTTDVGFGRLKSNFKVEQWLEFMSQNSAAQPLCDSLNQDASRSWFGNANFTLDTGDFSTTLSVRYLPGYNNWQARDTQNKSCGYVGRWDVKRDADTGALLDAGTPLKVSSYVEFGLNTVYSINSNQSLTVGIRNLLDKNPPHSEVSWPFYTQGTYSNLGRFVYMGYNVSF